MRAPFRVSAMGWVFFGCIAFWTCVGLIVGVW